MGKPKSDASQCFLAIDLGASSGRAVLGRFGDGGLEVEEVHRFPNRPVEVGGTLYWDMDTLFDEVCEGIRRGLDRAGGRLSGVGVDTWGVDFGLLDREGRLIENPVHYRDRRTEGIMERVFEVVPRKRIFAATGIQFLPFNTLFQLAAIKFEDPGRLSEAATMLMMPDLFHYLLCGSKTSEFTIATTTQFYDPRKNGWARAMLDELEIPLSILPKIVNPGTVVGKLDRKIAPGDIPVITPAAHDTGSAVAAVPADSEAEPGSWAYISSGTWSLMGIEVKEPILTDLALAFNFTNEGGVEGTYRFLKNIAGLWLVQECRRVWDMEDGVETSYEELKKMAEAAKPLQCLVDPDHPIFLRPEHMPDAIARFCRMTGQPAPAGKGETARCILESLVMKYSAVRRELEEISGTRIERVHVVGGGSRDELLNRLTAGAIGVPVLAGPTEATAVGNLAVQAIAGGIIPDLASARKLIGESFPVKVYEPQETDTWEGAAQRFAEIIERGKGLS